MVLRADLLVTIAESLFLWVAGTVVFDGTHWLLHLFLRSRSPLLRLLAWPHGVHHRFLDAQLAIRPEYRRRNVWCHLVPEYLTQLAWSAAMLAWLPLAVVLGCAIWQTSLFALVLGFRGLDPNHRPVEILDAYRPSVLCSPAYHALHHVYPDAYWSAYTKVVDWIVGGGTCLAHRRFALAGGETPYGQALLATLAFAGVADVRVVRTPDPAMLAITDVLVLC